MDEENANARAANGSDPRLMLDASIQALRRETWNEAVEACIKAARSSVEMGSDGEVKPCGAIQVALNLRLLKRLGGLPDRKA